MGDFARRLGDALWQSHQIRSHFLVYRTPDAPFDASEISPNTLSYAAEASPPALLEEIDRLQQHNRFDCVLLHYGPYGYSRTGEPMDLVHEIEDLAEDTRILVFFHELYASGMPWKRAFWTNREQRESVGKLLKIADASFTSNGKYMQRLKRLGKANGQLSKIPIFSNLGEPKRLRALSQRSRQLIVFGQLVTRSRLYQEHRQALENICRKLRIQNVVDVGSGRSRHIPDSLAGAKVRSAGWMEENQLSELMADSVAGVVGYWPDVWEKSGVIAAYQAHALFPILVELEPRNIPAPTYLPYVLPDAVSALATANGMVPDATMQQIADAAHDYYMIHQSVQRCAEVISKTANNLMTSR